MDTQIELTSLALGPDNQLATAGGGEVRLFDIESKLTLASFAPNKSSVHLLRFSPQGSLLAVVGSFGRDVELWDTAAHNVVAILPTPDRLDDVAFSPDGRTLAASSQTGGVSVWEVVEPEVRVRFAGFDGPTRSLAFRHDGLLALGLWKGTMRFWSRGRQLNAGSSPSQTEGVNRPPTDGSKEEAPARDRSAWLAFDDRGRMITVEPEALRVLDAPPRCMHSTLVPLPESKGMAMSMPMLAASADGRTMAITRGTQVVLWRPNESTPPVVVKPPPANGRPRARREIPGLAGGNRQDPFVPPWGAIAVSPKGDRLYLLARNGGESQCWAIEDSEGGTGSKSARRLSLPDLSADGTCLALSVNGRLLAVGNRMGGVTVIDTTTGKTRHKLPGSPGGAEGFVSSLAFSPDGNYLAVGAEQGHIDLWSLADLAGPLVRLPGHRGRVSSLAFDAQGDHLASAVSDKTVDIWDLEHLGEAFGKLGLAW